MGHVGADVELCVDDNACKDNKQSDRLLVFRVDEL